MRKRFRLALLGYLFLSLAVAVSLYKVDAQAERGDEARSALCALKMDLSRREDSSRRFMNELLSGERKPIPGITVADIRRSVRNQRATLQALKTLDCH